MSAKINVKKLSLNSLKNHVDSALEIVMRNYDGNIEAVKKAGWRVIESYDKETKKSLGEWLVKHLPESYCMD
jgi:hypothetical protein